MKAEVKAAGGVIVRDVDGRPEVLLVHRPRYDDWSFPKGKREPGESMKQCARREVVEETGLRVRVGDELPRVTYRDRKGRSKLVRYWKMTVKSGTFTKNDEVDEAEWLDFDAARKRLSYSHDAALLDALDVS